MAERHAFTCDVCEEETEVPCSEQSPAALPSGWTEEGKRHYCVECSALNAALDGET